MFNYAIKGVKYYRITLITLLNYTKEIIFKPFHKENTIYGDYEWISHNIFPNISLLLLSSYVTKARSFLTKSTNNDASPIIYLEQQLCRNEILFAIVRHSYKEFNIEI